mmetsp:Transcript_2379/g.5171  ORF Transcript_2379/g.5171 Transcript_2379/m.5171 type:complete len:233 (-) Transcript_2379:380-1078(-)
MGEGLRHHAHGLVVPLLPAVQADLDRGEQVVRHRQHPRGRDVRLRGRARAPKAVRLRRREALPVGPLRGARFLPRRGPAERGAGQGRQGAAPEDGHVPRRPLLRERAGLGADHALFVALLPLVEQARPRPRLWRRGARLGQRGGGQGDAARGGECQAAGGGAQGGRSEGAARESGILERADCRKVRHRPRRLRGALEPRLRPDSRRRAGKRRREPDDARRRPEPRPRGGGGG